MHPKPVVNHTRNDRTVRYRIPVTLGFIPRHFWGMTEARRTFDYGSSLIPDYESPLIQSALWRHAIDTRETTLFVTVEAGNEASAIAELGRRIAESFPPVPIEFGIPRRV